MNGEKELDKDKQKNKKQLLVGRISKEDTRRASRAELLRNISDTLSSKQTMSMTLCQ